MLVLSARSASQLFSQACAAVLASGSVVAPRGLATRELLGVHICLTEPRRRLVELPPVRLLNVAFAAAETVWILSGSGAPWIHRYNRQLSAVRRRRPSGRRVRPPATPVGRQGWISWT